MKLTRRGEIVIFGGGAMIAFAIGIATANWCWYGYCGL